MLTLNFDPFPQLETKRLLLRRITKEDAADLLMLRSDKEIMKYIARPLMHSVEEIIAFIKSIDEAIDKQDVINWGITLKTDNKVIGTMGFYRMAKENYRAEVGYMLHSKFQKQGIMQEAIEAALTYAFTQMKAHTIGAVIDPRNKASENVLLKNKFVKEAHFKEDCFFEGAFLDSVHYSLLAKEGH